MRGEVLRNQREIPRSEEKNKLIVIATLAALCSTAYAEDFVMPERKTRATPEAVLAEHIDALKHCDLNRIMAQYPNDGTFILPDGVWMEAPYLKEPYKGSDAYVTKDGLMHVQVTTFKVADMKFKE
jgi:hypothetical protein